MTNTAFQEPSVSARELTFSLAALKGLASVNGLGSGALSPLGRVPSPPGPARWDELVRSFEALSGPWAWFVPALIDPLMTASMVLSDRETVLIGQYAWPDADARGPGFKVNVQGGDLRVAGPLSLFDVGQTFLSFLSLAGVGELGALRMSLTSEQFWAVCALADAYRDACLRRELARTPGQPVGISASQAVAAWQAGLGAPNPGWCVSLFAMLVPATVPADLDRRLPAVMASMAAGGMLTRLEGDGSPPAEPFYFLDEGLDDLCRALYRSGTNFGLVVQRKRPPSVQVAVLGGWRTSDGILLADVGRISEGRVEMVLGGPSVLVESLQAVLGPAQPVFDFTSFSMATRFTRDSILGALRASAGDMPTVVRPRAGSAAPGPGAGPAAAPVPERQAGACPRCGHAVKPGARFCPDCGYRFDAAPQVCGRCGNPTVPGGRFCGVCGAPLP